MLSNCRQLRLSIALAVGWMAMAQGNEPLESQPRIYSWTDEDGKVQFSTAPPGADDHPGFVSIYDTLHGGEDDAVAGDVASPTAIDPATAQRHSRQRLEFLQSWLRDVNNAQHLEVEQRRRQAEVIRARIRAIEEARAADVD
ncbi:MAG: hypothetical protein ACFCBW_07675 [Candidatus Competibacterales bacterium]